MVKAASHKQGEVVPSASECITSDFIESEDFERYIIQTTLNHFGHIPADDKKRSFGDIKAIKTEIKNTFDTKNPFSAPNSLSPSKTYFKLSPSVAAFWKRLGELFVAPGTAKNFEKIALFLSDLSTMQIRHVRLIATFSAYSLMRGIAKARAKVVKHRTIAKGGLNRRTSADKKKRKRTDLAELNEIKKKMDAVLGIGLKKIVAQRYRDVCESVRRETVETLCALIGDCPKVFFKDQNLRYIGWLLCDRNNDVRKAALDGLCKLYKKKNNVERLSAFTERFFGRFLEMLSDRGSNVVRAAVRLVTIFFENDLLEQTDDDSMSNLLWHPLIKVRYDAADFFMIGTFKRCESPFDTIKALISLCGRGAEIEKDFSQRVFTLVGNFIEKIPLLTNWNELFKIINGDKLEPDSNKNVDSELNLNESERPKRSNGKNPLNLNKPVSKRVKMDDKGENKLKDNELKTFFEILKCVAVFEDALSKKDNDEQSPTFKELTLETLEFFPDLLLQYKLDKEIIVPLFALAEHFDFPKADLSCNSQLITSFKEAISSIFESVTAQEVIEQIAKTLSCHCDKDKSGLKETLFSQLREEFVGDITDGLNTFDVFEREKPSNQDFSSEKSKLVNTTEDLKTSLTKLYCLLKFSNLSSQKINAKCTKILKLHSECLFSGLKSPPDPLSPLLAKLAVPALNVFHWNSFWEIQSESPRNETTLSTLHDFHQTFVCLGDQELKKTSFVSFCDFAILSDKENFKDGLKEAITSFALEYFKNISRYRDDERFNSIVNGAAKILLVYPAVFEKIGVAFFKLIGEPINEIDKIAKVTLKSIKEKSNGIFIRLCVKALAEIPNNRKNAVLMMAEKTDRILLKKYVAAGNKEEQEIVLNEICEKYGDIEK